MVKRCAFSFSLLVSFSLLAQEQIPGIDRKNLGPEVNSKYTEMTPRISGDGKIMYFVREGDPKNKYKQEIWYSELGENGHWKQAVRAIPDLNRVDYNCVWSVNADGSNLLLRGEFVNGSFVGRGLSTIRRTKEGWSQPEMIKIENIETLDHGDNDGAWLSIDGQTLFFTLSEKMNSHNTDLYVSLKKEDGTFSKPVKLPGNINSTYKEFAPFLASDNKTLYFSSDRPGGLGQSDIYKAERKDTSWTNWSDPVNLGESINTPQKDGYYVTDAKGEYAYLVSEQNSLGGADIVRFKLSKDQSHQPVALVTGNVLNAKTKKPVEATIEYNIYPKDVDEGIVHSDHATGNYKLILPFGNSYTININAKGYVPYYDTISSVSGADYKELKRDFLLVPLEVGQSVILDNIFFESGKSELLPESEYQLEKIVELLKAHHTMEIEVRGHTDDVGDDANNQKLSLDRATAVVNYLAGKGILASKLKAKGFGELKPIVANDSDENRKKNRRVEFLILKK